MAYMAVGKFLRYLDDDGAAVCGLVAPVRRLSKIDSCQRLPTRAGAL